MARSLRVAAAQLGPTGRRDARSVVVDRLCQLMEGAARDRVDLVVFPELALTSFFPRWLLPQGPDLDAFYEQAAPEQFLVQLLELARGSRMGFSIGFAEKTIDANRTRHFNTTVLYDQSAALVGKYRKIHLPGDRVEMPGTKCQHLEKRYFETGDLGFTAWRAFGGVVGMLICNDRRWPEAWRVLGLQGVELVLVGFNTPLHNPEAPEHDRLVGSITLW